jgi:acyl carrier protein
LDLVEVVLALEERFNIQVNDEQIAGVTTVGEAVDLVRAQAAARADSARS